MKYVFSGTCSQCGRYTKVEATTEDGQWMVNLAHGEDYGHGFFGQAERGEECQPVSEPAPREQSTVRTSTAVDPKDKVPKIQSRGGARNGSRAQR